MIQQDLDGLNSYSRFVTRPFMTWIGGKRNAITKQLRYLIPYDFGSFHELFLGGGAMSFFIFDNTPMIESRRFYAYDINARLINAYKQVRDRPDELINLLGDLSARYISEKVHSDDYSIYYSTRESIDTGSDLEQAVKFIFLIQSGFSGMYVVGVNDSFRTPPSSHHTKSSKMCQSEKIQLASRALRYIDLKNCDVVEDESWLERIREGDFVFMDPPYHETANPYEQEDYDDIHQAKYKGLFTECNKRGCYVMMTNSDTELIQDYYNGFIIKKYSLNHNINKSYESEDTRPELVIVNYEFKDGKVSLVNY